jgi:micrococcal nuclease
MRRPVAQPPTLADLASAGALNFAVWCSEFRRSRRLPLGGIIAKAGGVRSPFHPRPPACGAQLVEPGPSAHSRSTPAHPRGWSLMRELLLMAAVGLFAVSVASDALSEPGVCRAIDGDTYVCHGERIRVQNIDAPELHARCVSEFDAARSAKLFAQHALDGAIIIEIRVHERRPRDKYGRTLARVVVDGDDLGDLMIEAGLARPYQGERRLSWCE